MGRNMVTRDQDHQLNDKHSLISWGLRVPIRKIKFCSRVLRLSM